MRKYHRVSGPVLGAFFVSLFGVGAAVLSVYCVWQMMKRQIVETKLEKIRAERGYVLIEEDLNGNGVPEQFYEICGKKAFLSVDGKTLEEIVEPSYVSTGQDIYYTDYTLK